jgi:hypothetical protein
MNFKERFSRKLYNPRNIEGVAKKEVFEIVEIIYRTLADEKEFVGVAPFGSSVNGYSTRASDIDVRLYLELPDIPKDLKIRMLLGLDVDDFLIRSGENHARTKELTEKAIKALEQMNFDISNIHVLPFVLSKAENIIRIQKGLNEEGDAEIIGALFRIVKGGRIKEFRDSAIEQLKKLSEEERNRQVELIAQALSQSELMSFHKINDRTDEPLDPVDLHNTRAAMWKDRIFKFLN